LKPAFNFCQGCPIEYVCSADGECADKLLTDLASPSAAPRSETLAATEGVSAKEQVLAVYPGAYVNFRATGGACICDSNQAGHAVLAEGKTESEAWEAAALKVNESAAQGRKEQ
jgi:hypothetical protein